MKKLNYHETFRFFFKLILLLKLFSHLKSTTEATQISHLKSRGKLAQFEQHFPKKDGINLNDRMSQIEAKSQRQENEISLLKTTVVADKIIIRQLRGRVSILESLIFTRNSETNEEILLRQKRPFRLLPPHPVGGEVRDKKGKKKATESHFYGPASNCNELEKLGYTLNGYYLVKGKDESIRNNIEAVLCRFKLPNESKGGIYEERLGSVNVMNNVEKSQEEQFGVSRLPDRNTVAYPSPRRANLINDLGKCLNSGDYPGYNDIYSGINLHQWDCNPSVHTMLWSWNQSTLGSKDRHLCDGSKYCVTTPGNVNWSHPLVAFVHKDQKSQRFTFVDSLTYPGFYVIKNDHGKCLSVEGNTNQTGARIWANDCNPSDAGNRWKWRN